MAGRPAEALKLVPNIIYEIWNFNNLTAPSGNLTRIPLMMAKL